MKEIMCDTQAIAGGTGHRSERIKVFWHGIIFLISFVYVNRTFDCHDTSYTCR